MARFTFPSMAHGDKIAYAFDSMNAARYTEVDSSALFFETLGDGMCQHSPDRPIPYNYFTDYCYSLAAFLLEHPERASDCSSTFRDWFGIPAIEFAASIRYREGKPAWYSLDERKVSTSESKRNDRRYESVEKWMNGSADAIARLLRKNYFSPLREYLMLLEIRQWTFSLPSGSKAYTSCSPDMPGIGEGLIHDVRREQKSALECLQNVFASLDSRERAECGLGNWRRAIERSQEQADAA